MILKNGKSDNDAIDTNRVRKRGQQPLSQTEDTVFLRARVTRSQLADFRQLGGSKWLRDQIIEHRGKLK